MTRTENYQPQIGTGAAKITAFLHSLPVGVECTSARIVEATGLDNSFITPNAETPIKHELIVREQVGRRWLYRRGPRELAEEVVSAYRGAFKPTSDEPDLRAQHMMSTPDLSPRTLPGDAVDAPVMAVREAMRRPPRREEAAPLTAGLWSDGRLTIERNGGEPIVFTQSETFHLIKFLAACGRLRDILQGEASS